MFGDFDLPLFGAAVPSSCCVACQFVVAFVILFVIQVDSLYSLLQVKLFHSHTHSLSYDGLHYSRWQRIRLQEGMEKVYV